MSGVCRCRPVRVVGGVEWRYRRRLGWHEPGSCTRVRGTFALWLWENCGATPHSETPNGLASAGVPNPQLDDYIERG